MYSNKLWRGLLVLLVFSSICARSAWSQTATTSGDLVVEASTLTAIGVEWKITGDDNRNAVVDVTYRRKGEQEWHKALPLMRIHHEVINGGAAPFIAEDANSQNAEGERGNPFHYDTGNMFSGSILSLEPGTAYECRFVLSDPDGVSGNKEKTITVETRSEPKPAEGGHVYNVYPIGWSGPKTEPAFVGLMQAYDMGHSSGDHERAFPPRVQPGDVILVHAGVYQDDTHHYLPEMPRPGHYGLAGLIDGTYYLDQSGTPDKPIVIKAAGDGEVIFDGNGNENLFNLLVANYNYFEGITVRNTTVAFLLGWKGIAGSSGFTLVHSRVYDVARVVQAEWSGSRDFYIADNIFIGRHDPSKMMSWTGKIFQNLPGFPELLLSEYAVKVYGQGHVVAHNYFANWHDGVDVSTYGEPDGTPDIASDKLSGPSEMEDKLPASIDFYDNDFFNMGDNCIEADGGAHNIRVFENRCFDPGAQALSAQPIFGGPVYFYKNLVYNSLNSGPLKFANTPAGILVYQNTFVDGDTSPGLGANEHFLNNLFLGRGTKSPTFSVTTSTNYSTSDYNGFAINKDAPFNFGWASPMFNVAADYDYTHKLTARHFGTLKEYSEATGQDKHSILIDYDAFMNAPMADNSDPQHLYNPEDIDLRLRPNSAAIDAGTVLPTINDGYKGRAPDLGAYELGQPIPEYGPRSEPSGTIPIDKFGFRSWDGPPRKDLHLIPQ